MLVVTSLRKNCLNFFAHKFLSTCRMIMLYCLRMSDVQMCWNMLVFNHAFSMLLSVVRSSRKICVHPPLPNFVCQICTCRNHGRGHTLRTFFMREPKMPDQYAGNLSCRPLVLTCRGCRSVLSKTETLENPMPGKRKSVRALSAL